MNAAVFAFAESFPAATRLGGELGVPTCRITAQPFPDGESLVRIHGEAAIAILYRSLDAPNAKLVELLLAASALRDAGARRVVMVAPYLAYMRQDAAFHRGEAVSQRVIGKLLAEHFDAVMTVDPHLHRTHSLAAIMPGIRTAAVSAAPALSAALDWTAQPLVTGPDEESKQWVEAIAAPLEFDVLIGRKRRLGGREVELDFPKIERAAHRYVVLVDDMIASGETLITAAALLQRAGAARVDALTTHCLARTTDIERMFAAGIARVFATDTIPGPVGTIPVATLLASEIRRRGWLRK